MSYWEINASPPWFKLGLRELYYYQDLILNLVKRDLFAGYKQSLLGPLWIILQPLMTTVVYMVIFSHITKISTDGIPSFLFYFPGIIIWTYFSECVIGTMNTFIHQSHIFSKVYFPRLVVPLSQVITNTVKLCIQLLLFALVYIWYAAGDHSFHIHQSVLLLPFLIGITALFATGCGLLVSVLTARFRDLENIVHFVLRLLMFATPVIYPASIVPEIYRDFFWANPLTSVIETLRVAFFSHSVIQWQPLLISSAVIVVFSYLAAAIFKKNEVLIMDVI